MTSTTVQDGSDNPLRDRQEVEDGERIATALERNGALTSLDLRRNGIGDRGAESIAAVLEHNNTLTSRRLELNGAGGMETSATQDESADAKKEMREMVKEGSRS